MIIIIKQFLLQILIRFPSHFYFYFQFLLFYFYFSRFLILILINYHFHFHLFTFTCSLSCFTFTFSLLLFSLSCFTFTFSLIVFPFSLSHFHLFTKVDTDTMVLIIEQFLLLILIMGRFMMPRVGILISFSSNMDACWILLIKVVVATHIHKQLCSYLLIGAL